jgi:hypothetical protein
VGTVTPGDMPGWFTAHRHYLRRLAARREGFAVRPVVYFRQPEELAVSLYKEHVVRRLLPGRGFDFEAFLAMTAPYYEYARHVDALGDVLGDVVTRDYAAARRIGLQADFAGLVGARNLPPPIHSAVRSSPGNKATLWLAAQQGRSRRDHVRRVLFALRAPAEGPFSEPGPTTLWPDRPTFERFVERHRAAWDMPFLSVPTWRDLPPVAWTPDDLAATEVAFREWEARNLALLRRREARSLAFFEPDPA